MKKRLSVICDHLNPTSLTPGVISQLSTNETSVALSSTTEKSLQNRGEGSTLKPKPGQSIKLPVFRFDQEKYTCVVDTPSKRKPLTKNIVSDVNNGKLRVATFNILFDNYTPELLHNHVRYEKQFEMFEQMNFDILVLNEVTPTYLSRLIMNEFIMNTYYLSEVCRSSFRVGDANNTVNTAYSTVVPYGTIILSKFPIESLDEYTYKFGYNEDLSLVPLTRNKACLFAKIAVPLGNDKVMRLGLCGLHLKAGNAQHNIEQRRQQLIELEQYLNDKMNEFDEYLMLGDFNFLFKNEDEFVSKSQFTDLWVELKGANDPGYTLDNTLNTLVQMMSLPVDQNQEPFRWRLDRIYRWTGGKALNPRDMTIFAMDPVWPDKNARTRSNQTQRYSFLESNQRNQPQPPKEEYLHLSDHFGVCVQFDTTK